MIRNIILYDKPAITVGYGVLPLSTRLAFNRMTNEEYYIGFVYHLPGIGRLAAKSIFGQEPFDRLDYLKYYKSERDIVRNEISKMVGSNISNYRREQEIIPLSLIINEYIFNDIVNHLKITLFLAWRGVFIESPFGFIGILFLIWTLFSSAKNDTHKYMYIIAFPPLIMLFLNAALTASIPRYNLILLLPMSIAITIGLMQIVNAIVNWKINK